MVKSINLMMQEFEEGLLAYVNSSHLPVKAKSLMVNSVAETLKQANMMMVAQERAKLEQETKESDK